MTITSVQHARACRAVHPPILIIPIRRCLSRVVSAVSRHITGSSPVPDPRLAPARSAPRRPAHRQSLYSSATSAGHDPAFPSLLPSIVVSSGWGSQHQHMQGERQGHKPSSSCPSASSPASGCRPDSRANVAPFLPSRGPSRPLPLPLASRRHLLIL